MAARSERDASVRNAFPFHAAMRSVAVLLVLIGVIPAASSATARSDACRAYNPGHPTCTLYVKKDSNTDVTGWSAVGKWTVTIHRGDKIVRFRSPSSGEPTLHLRRFRRGDRVHAAALAPGSYVSVGYVAP